MRRILSINDGPMEMGIFRFIDQPATFYAPPIDSHYISVTLKGNTSVERVLSGETLKADFTPGSCVIMAAGQDNGWRWNSEMDEVHFFMRPDYLTELADECGCEDMALSEQFGFNDSTISRLALILLESASDHHRQQRIWMDSAAQMLGLHLIGKYTVSGTKSVGVWGLTQRQLNQLKEFVIENIDDDFTLSDLADVAGLSRYHFCRLFKKSVGVTPLQWVTATRIHTAKRLLAETDDTIAAIALSVGYENQAHFGQVFKKHTGLTPRQYRLRHSF